MSSLSIREYFPFCRVKITKQRVLVKDRLTMIYLEPDNRYFILKVKQAFANGNVN